MVDCWAVSRAALMVALMAGASENHWAGLWATPMVAEWADSTVDSWVALLAAEWVDCSDKKRAAH